MPSFSRNPREGQLVKRILSFLTKRARWPKTRFEPSFDPYTYTKGRWLNRDKEKRDARTLHFNFDALLDEAVRCSPGARRVIDCEKKEGGFNRVFMVHLDNESTVVARMPTRIAGPPRLATSSEVATLQYLKRNTIVPVPDVLAWNADPDNSIGSEYMILEEIPGVQLKDVWNDMAASDHIACISSMGRFCRKLFDLEFPAYGSLYLNSDAPSGAIRLDESFCIGPVCAPQYWNRTLGSTAGAKPPDGLQGPWRTVEDYFSDHIARARHNLRIDTKKAKAGRHDLLSELEQTLLLLANQADLEEPSKPILSHPDFHTRNIFVDAEDHTKITGIIDWQSATIEPAFVFAAATPDFAQQVEQEDNEDCTEEEKAHNAKVRLDAEFSSRAWAVMQQPCEKLRPASRLDSTLLDVLAAPSFGWVDNNIAVEHLLNNLAEKWQQLGLPGQSIHQPSKDEDFARELDEYQATTQLQEHLVRYLRCDNNGFVADDRWEEVLPLYRAEYQRHVESVVKSEECTTDEERAMAVGKADRLWPFDQR